MIKVSVIIPVFNAKNTIETTINTILNQTIKEIEIICVDDGSIDDSSSVIKEIIKKDNRVKYYYQENQGAGSARNKGITQAKGKYISFIDADDQYPSNETLRLLYEKADRHHVNICGGNVRYNDGEKDILLYPFFCEGIKKFEEYQIDSFFVRYLYNTNFLKENEIYFPKYRVYEDPVFLAHAMICSGEFYAITESTYIYSGPHQSQEMNLKKTKDFLRGINDNLLISSKYNLEILHQNTFERVEKQANYYAEKLLITKSSDIELMRLLIQVNNVIDIKLLQNNQVEINNDYVLPALITLWETSKKYYLLESKLPINMIRKLKILIKKLKR